MTLLYSKPIGIIGIKNAALTTIAVVGGVGIYHYVSNLSTELRDNIYSQPDLSLKIEKELQEVKGQLEQNEKHLEALKASEQQHNLEHLAELKEIKDLLRE